jgi:hypothetical protein
MKLYTKLQVSFKYTWLHKNFMHCTVFKQDNSNIKEEFKKSKKKCHPERWSYNKRKIQTNIHSLALIIY